MKAISVTARCISIDLPGHGHSLTYPRTNKKPGDGYDMSVESVAHTLMKVICKLNLEGAIVVGYSMGARIALYMALKYDKKVTICKVFIPPFSFKIYAKVVLIAKIDGAVIVSGSPGLRSESTRIMRALQDEARAHDLVTHGLEYFLETWYAGKLWKR